MTTGYAVLRLIHSYWRWAVLAAALWAFVRALPGRRGAESWTAADERASKLWVIAVDIQFLLGLILYFFFSPYWPAIHASFAAAMHQKEVRFFGIEHQFAMLLGVVATHIGRVRVRRAATAGGKRRALLVWTIVFLVLTFAGLPWPWREIVGRPFFRTAL